MRPGSVAKHRPGFATVRVTRSERQRFRAGSPSAREDVRQLRSVSTHRQPTLDTAVMPVRPVAPGRARRQTQVVARGWRSTDLPPLERVPAKRHRRVGMAKEDLARLLARLQAQTAVQTQRTFALQATMTCVFRELAKDPKFEEAINALERHL